MTTISVPLSKEQAERLDVLVANGVGENKAAVMRKALERLAEEEAVNAVLFASQEPDLKGDIRELVKKIGR